MDVPKQILSQIKNSKYKNQRGLAKALGMSESQLSQSLRLLSANFVEKLEEKGFKIDISNKDDHSLPAKGNLPINNNYTKEIVKRAIKGRYGTIKKYAEKKDITEDAMYERLQYLSDNFISELKQDGILIDISSNPVFNSCGSQRDDGINIEELRAQIGDLGVGNIELFESFLKKLEGLEKRALIAESKNAKYLEEIRHMEKLLVKYETENVSLKLKDKAEEHKRN